MQGIDWYWMELGLDRSFLEGIQVNPDKWAVSLGILVCPLGTVTCRTVPALYDFG